MSVENELTLAELAKRVQKLEAQVELHRHCHEDNNAQIHKLTADVYAAVSKIEAFGKSLRQTLINIGCDVVTNARNEVQAVTDKTKKEALHKIVHASSQDIIQALTGKILVVRNATREEQKSGLCVPTRMARHDEK